MFVGAITEYIDVAQIALYVFWAFFFVLVLYLHREAKREGYPLVSDRSDKITHQGFPAMPRPKRYRLPYGEDIEMPGDRREGAREINATPLGGFLGAPLVPDGDPLVDGVGPAAWAERRDVPDIDNADGGNRIRPLATLGEHYRIASFSVDPRGLEVRAADGLVVGRVKEAWVDHMEAIVRYYEVERDGGGSVLVPMMVSSLGRARRAPAGGSLFDRLKARRPYEIRVDAITAAQFANAPTLADPAQVTMREEDRIQGYFGGGFLYATPQRTESLI